MLEAPAGPSPAVAGGKATGGRGRFFLFSSQASLFLLSCSLLLALASHFPCRRGGMATGAADGSLWEKVSFS